MNDDGTANRFINPAAVRREDQRVVMEEIKKQGHCPFCREHLEKYHSAPIIKEGEYWILTKNQWPYEKVKHQFLAIHKEHVEHISEVTPEAGAELFAFFAATAKEYGFSGGGMAIRFGSSEHGSYGSSVLHIHAHLIEPDLEALEESEAWKFKFGQPKNYKKKEKA